ncbi:MAG: SpoIID/LytB domain-containing protein [Bacteroidales bacterium]|nr:SpoIID/LytB domain-containing protein [Bacteroidales bacterium]
MIGIRIFIIFLLSVISTLVSAQVKIRLFANQSPESAVFTVVEGSYSINTYHGGITPLSKGESLIISRFDGKLAVKTRNSTGYIADSVLFSEQTPEASFSLRINGQSPVRQYYTGDLHCFPDLGTLVMINNCDVEKYIAGVVKAEGGSGKNIEYFKSQAVIARTYMYKYFDKHMQDKYNVCDNTHCQAFNGTSTDTILNKAAMETHGEVILDQDSVLIISAFHSNCGGETSSSEDVWLTSQPYLKRVIDPYCLTSRNALWERSIALEDWVGYLRKSGFSGNSDDPSQFGFTQKSRLTTYKAGTFTVPLRTIRTDLNLRSTFFSVLPEGDTIKLKGRGYGHGVGLCQEGAMAMAAKGFDYKQIIDFYYVGVLISDIANLPPNPPKGGLSLSY